MNGHTIRYLLSGIYVVDGWLDLTTAHIMAMLSEQQTHLGLSGDLAEIGIHHGKSFFAFANAAVPGEKLFAVDVFEDQHKNVDRSGNGSRQTFLSNLAAYAPDATVEIIQESSLDLFSLGWPLSHRESIRFFSIDGSHTRKATLNDLKIADLTTKPGAIVAVDDILSMSWLGVISGVFDYLCSEGNLFPFALVHNKLLFVKGKEHMDLYLEYLSSYYKPLKKGVQLLDHPIDVFEKNPELTRKLIPTFGYEELVGSFRYEAEAFHFPQTETWSTNGSSIIGAACRDGCVIWGPYMPLPRGKFKLCHSLQVETGLDSKGTLIIDVCKNNGGNILASREMSIEHGRPIKELDLDFFSEGGDEVFEFRIHKEGRFQLIHGGATILREG